jgi:hypothetical protein
MGFPLCFGIILTVILFLSYSSRGNANGFKTKAGNQVLGEMTIRVLAIIAASTAMIVGVVNGQRGDVSRPPIIDMHMHAVPADYFGKPPTKMCSTGDV